MKIAPNQPDKMILVEVGRRLARRRLDVGMTQMQLAYQSGLSRSTIERIEAGESAQLSSLIRILRTLDMLDALDTLIAEPGPGPMALLKLKGKERRRAPKAKLAEKAPAAWVWGDEQ